MTERAPYTDDFQSYLLKLTNTTIMADAYTVIESWKQAAAKPAPVVAVYQDGLIAIAPGTKIGQVLNALDVVRERVLGLSIDGKP